MSAVPTIRAVPTMRDRDPGSACDAVGLLAERALAAGFGGGECDGSHDSGDGDLGEPRVESGTRAERYQVMGPLRRRDSGGGG